MMVWLIATAILVLIASIPLGGSIQYDSEGLRIRIVAGLIRFTIFPLRKKKDKTAPKEKEQKPKSNSGSKSNISEKKPEKKGESLKYFIPLIKVGLDFLNTFRKKLRVDHLTIKLFLGGDDPCDLAVNYGRAWASLEGLIAALENVLTIGKRDIQVDCDFSSEQTTVAAGLDLTVTVGRLTVMMFKYGFLVIKELLIIKKKRKGGAKA